MKTKIQTSIGPAFWRRAFLVASACVAGGFVLVGLGSTAHAETEVVGLLPQAHTTWTREGSPYVLKGSTSVPSGGSLRIMDGVVVRGVPGREVYSNILINNGASLRVEGTKEGRVKFEHMNSIAVIGINASANIANADFRMSGPLNVNGAKTLISSSTFMGASGSGIYIASANVKIENSRVENNPSGVEVYDVSGKPAFVEIKNSIITATAKNEYAINNHGVTSVKADRNWWGTPEGPAGATSSRIMGSVSYTPWLSEEPPLLFGYDTPQDCCSNILLLPGLQATRLYSQNEQLWEPGNNGDVQQLMMNEEGKSIDESIYSGDPISKAYGIVPVYKSFMEYLDGLVREGKIKEWKSFGYDWRKPISEVVAGMERRATTSESIVLKVRELAKNSPTGKVTLIAHSNGGLVAKMLVKTLAERGEENLIDKVISVAVPYIGTPQALLGLLHGDNQSIGFGLILKKSVAMNLGLNMPSAYSLLPSAEYFGRLLGPTVAFAGAYEGVGPSEPLEAQRSVVSTMANGALMAAAEFIHGMIDPFHWPVSIAKWAVVGWNKRTAKGIVYTDEAEYGYTATTTVMGDGTVVSGSATFGSATTTAVDLSLVSIIEDRNIKHSNILESSSTQAVIGAIVTGDAASAESKISSIPGVSLGEPDKTVATRGTVVVSTHSPVELHVYDERGNHTGLVPIPVDSDVESSMFSMFESEIPGSDFEMYGDESSPQTYISLPEPIGGEYRVEIKGIGIGGFSFKIERMRGDTTVSTTLYSGLPVTHISVATTSIGSALEETNAALNIDADGDGDADSIAKPGDLDPQAFLETMRASMEALVSDPKLEKELSKQIDAISKDVTKEKMKGVIKQANKIAKAMSGHRKLSQLSAEEKTALSALVEEFIKSMN